MIQPLYSAAGIQLNHILWNESLECFWASSSGQFHKLKTRFSWFAVSEDFHRESHKIYEWGNVVKLQQRLNVDLINFF